MCGKGLCVCVGGGGGGGGGEGGAVERGKQYFTKKHFPCILIAKIDSFTQI